MRIARCLLPHLLLIVCLAPYSSALGNGALAHAYPIGPVTLDGELGEWPTDLPRYSIEHSYFGNAPSDPDDFHGEFRVAYHAESGTLYLAVEVTDEVHLVESEDRAWWDDDSCVVYFDKTHSPAGSGPIAYAVAGSRRELSGNNGLPWDPVVAAGTWADAKCALIRKDNKTTYEWAIQTGAPLASRTALGLDITCIDLDEGEPASAGSLLAWGEGKFKNRQAGRCGSVILIEHRAELGTLRGEVQRSSGYTGPLPERLRMTSKENPSLWFDVTISGSGQYEVEAPSGEYHLAPNQFVLESSGTICRISDSVRAVSVVDGNSTTDAPPLLLKQTPAPRLSQEDGILLDFAADRSKQVDQFVEAWMTHYGIPGVSPAIVHDGGVVYEESFGVANSFTGAKVDDSTLFEAASITKAVFAFCVMRLVDKGVVDLDRPLYLDLPFPELLHDERHKLLTARIILSHRSGLPNWGAGDGSEIPFRFTPGTEYAYSGEAFEYLGRALTKLDGRDIESILREECLAPMGFDGPTAFRDSPELRIRASRGHRLPGPTKGSLPAEVGVAHSMFSNAGELAKFMAALLERRGLRASTYDDLLAFHSERPSGEIAVNEPWRKGMGLGFMVMESPFGLAFGHDGNNGDFRANFEAYPELNAGYVLLANHSLGGRLSDQLRTFLITGYVE